MDGRTRTWEQIVPRSKLADSAPIIVVLSGINATVSQEISRDKLVPYVNAGDAELIYPAGFDKSWNAESTVLQVHSGDVSASASRRAAREVMPSLGKTW